MIRSARRALILVLATLAACAVDDPASSTPDLIPANAKPGGGGGDIPVTATVADANLAMAPTLQIRSDGAGTYSNSSALSSIIQAIGAWVLDSKNPGNATRQFYLDFSEHSSPVPSGLYRARMISKCNLRGTSMQALAPGATMSCPLHVAFAYNGGEYAVQMNPIPGGASEGYPETNDASVTCVVPASGSGPCTTWTLTPSASYLVGGTLLQANVAKLLKYVTSKGKTTAMDQGDFYFSFQITVTSP